MPWPAELIKPALRLLDVSRSAGVTDPGLKAVVDATKALEALRLAHCPGFTDVAIRATALASPALRVLDVSAAVLVCVPTVVLVVLVVYSASRDGFSC
jgi:hypothetical protein